MFFSCIWFMFNPIYDRWKHFFLAIYVQQCRRYELIDLEKQKINNQCWKKILESIQHKFVFFFAARKLYLNLCLFGRLAKKIFLFGIRLSLIYGHSTFVAVKLGEKICCTIFNLKRTRASFIKMMRQVREEKILKNWYNGLDITSNKEWNHIKQKLNLRDNPFLCFRNIFD